MTIYTNVFISHSWAYSGHYNKLSEWIFVDKWESGETQLVFVDKSVPKDDPIHNAPLVRDLRNAIYARISASDVIVIPTGMYANYSKWIQEEINGAAEFSKPILAVDPRGQERKSSIVANAAKKSVGWTKQSVINGIWELR